METAKETNDIYYLQSIGFNNSKQKEVAMLNANNLLPRRKQSGLAKQVVLFDDCFNFNPITPSVHKMVKHALKILQQEHFCENRIV